MQYSIYRLVPVLTVALTLCGCSTLDSRIGIAFPGAGLTTTSIDTSVKSLDEFQRADPRQNLNLDVYGLSYHTDRNGIHNKQRDNEYNIGLGFGYKLYTNDKGSASIHAGFYNDSGHNWAKVAGLGYQFNLGKRWQLGAGLMAIQSRTYNNGLAFVAPIPLLTYDLGAAKLNIVFAPRFKQFNQFSVFGMYFSIPFMK